MQAFADLIDDLDATNGSGQKVQRIAAYLQEQPPEDSAWTLLLLIGQRRRRLITGRRLRDVLQKESGMPSWLFAACHSQVGDSAETISLLWPQLATELPRDSRPLGAELEPLILQMKHEPHLHWWMETLLPTIAALDETLQAQALIKVWHQLAPERHLLLNKLLTGGFRIGVARGLVVKAIARGFDLEETVVLERLMGPMEATVPWFQQLTAPVVDAPSDRGAVPYPFFLASPAQVDTLQQTPPRDWWVEHKWDGIRGQLIRRPSGVYLWSRGEELINDQFPELVTMAESLPAGTVLDGEVICWRMKANTPMPFSALQRRLGRKQVGRTLQDECPASFIAYDLIESQGEDLRARPLHERLAQLWALRGLSGEDAWRLRWSEGEALRDWEDLHDLRQNAVAAGAEGVMLKHRESPYLSGRKRGHWWKFKRDPMTLDAVLIYAQAGSGRRANLFTDYTFALWQRNAEGEESPQLVTFAKAYSGLDDQEILELDRWIRRHTRERFGPARAVEPELVFEIGFEGIQRSKRHKCGLAVRFPRILRWRKDRPANSADTINRAEELLALQPQAEAQA